MTSDLRLALDASTYGGTVVVVRGSVVLVERDVTMRGAYEERLMPAVVDALAAVGVVPAALGGIVCGGGPGSFTSLRIAASIAKGLAHAAGVPLYAAPSLALVVTGVTPPVAPGRYLTALGAMRGESYAAEVTIGPDGCAAAYAYLGIVPTSALDDLAHARDATRVEGEPHARGVVGLGALIADVGAVDLDAWEPDYGRKAEAQVKWEAAHGRLLRAEPAEAADAP